MNQKMTTRVENLSALSLGSVSVENARQVCGNCEAFSDSIARFYLPHTSPKTSEDATTRVAPCTGQSEFPDTTVAISSMTVEPTPTLGDLECASEFPTPKSSPKDNGVAVSVENIKYLW